MKRILVFLLMILSFSGFSQSYFVNGSLLSGTDSAYIKKLPKKITLTGLTRIDLRTFKALIIANSQNSDDAMNKEDNVIVSQIIADLKAKKGIDAVFEIKDLPINYVRLFSMNKASEYDSYIDRKKEVDSYLRVAKNVQKIDTALYLINPNGSMLRNKQSLKKDIKSGL